MPSKTDPSADRAKRSLSLERRGIPATKPRSTVPKARTDKISKVAAPRQSSAGDTAATNGPSESGQRNEASEAKTPGRRDAKSRSRRRKRVRIGEALRKIGFDEYAIAQNYADAAERLKGNPDKSGNVEKLLIDVLKECSRLIEPVVRSPETAADRPGAAGAAIHVHLVHNVPRPARSQLTPVGTSPIVLDVSPPVDALPADDEAQAEQGPVRTPSLAPTSHAS